MVRMFKTACEHSLSFLASLEKCSKREKTPFSIWTCLKWEWRTHFHCTCVLTKIHHHVHFTALAGAVRCCYLCKWNMCKVNEDNDWQEHVPFSEPSAWIEYGWVFGKCPWVELSAPPDALPGGAAVQGCWFLHTFKHAQLISRLDFSVDFFRWSAFKRVLVPRVHSSQHAALSGTNSSDKRQSHDPVKLFTANFVHFIKHVGNCFMFTST